MLRALYKVHNFAEKTRESSEDSIWHSRLSRHLQHRCPIWNLDRVPAALLVIQFPKNVPKKAEIDGSSLWPTSAMRKTQVEFQATGFYLETWPFGE